MCISKLRHTRHESVVSTCYLLSHIIIIIIIIIIALEHSQSKWKSLFVASFWTNYYHAVHMFVNYFFTKYVNNAVFVCIDMSFVMLTFSVLFRCLCTGTWNMIEWNKWYEMECVQYCFLITTIMLHHNLLLFSYNWVPTLPNHTLPNPVCVCILRPKVRATMAT